MKRKLETAGQKSYLFALRLAMVLALTLAALRSEASPEIDVEIMRIGDATHFEFSGQTEWKYELKRDEKGTGRVVLLLKGLAPGAIGKLRGLSDSLIKSVKVDENSVDQAAEVSFQIADKTDYFDYISDRPTHLILDFFPKEAATSPEPAVAEAQTVDLKPTSLPEKRGDVKSKRKAKARIPAGDGLLVAKGTLPEGPTLAERISSKKDFSHGIFDGGDPEFRRFSIKDYEIKEDAIAASRANFYLPFPMLDLGVPQLKAVLSVPPTYEVVPGDSRENKEARVLLQLFSKKQRALFLKAADEFLTERPESPYNEMIRYMVADAHYDIYRASNSVQDFETAMSHYLALTEKYPDSPMVPRTLLLMGYSYLDRNDNFGALKVFQRFSRLYPNSKHINRVNISIAEAYLHLNRFDEAFKLLDQIEKTGTTPWGREEAAFRKGDVFFREHDDESAIREYKGALKRHPAAASRFPNAWYNLAEAQFRKNSYRESLESYRTFLQRFPDHEHGGYAMTRMGELLGILGAPEPRVEGAFMESYFRYRVTPGAGIARIRLLTSRMPEMKDKELASALDEVDEITKKYVNRPLSKKELEEKKASLLADAKKNEAAAKEGGGHEGGSPAGAAHGESADEEPLEALGAEAGVIARLVPKDGEDATHPKPELPGIEEFSTLLIADGLSARHEYDQALQNLVSYYQRNPQSANAEKIKIRIVRNIAEGINAAVGKDDFMDALRRYSKHVGGWLKNVERADIPFNVARAYEQAGVFKEAADVYDQCLARLEATDDHAAKPENFVFERRPSKDSVRLRQAAVAAAAGRFADAESFLKKIAKVPSLNETEQVERAEISAEVAEARGQPETARRYLTELIKDWKGDPAKTGPLHLRLARLETQSRNFKTADRHLATIIAWKAKDGALIPDDLHAKALEARAELHLKRGRRAEAVKVFRELLAAYEGQRPLESVRYRLGQVLFQDGDLKGAETAWNELQSAKDSLWHRLANEQMQGAKWQNEYKKYLQRIPAASDLRE